MGDVFKEQIVKKESGTKDKLIKVGVILVAIVLFIGFSMIPTLGPILSVAVVFGAYFLLGMRKVEYEYIFTNGELDIDAVYNKNRRKRLYTGNVKDFELMAHINDKDHEGEFRGANETKNYSSGVVKNNTYAFLASYKGKQLKIIIEPNEMMLKAFQTAISPRKLHKHK